jgi:hypothetical protein
VAYISGAGGGGRAAGAERQIGGYANLGITRSSQPVAVTRVAQRHIGIIREINPKLDDPAYVKRLYGEAAGLSVLLDDRLNAGQSSRGWVHYLKSLHQLFRQLPSDFRRDSVHFAWRVFRHCPDQTPFILPFNGISFIHVYL